MSAARFRQDLRDQPQSIARVILHQLGPGREAMDEIAARLRKASHVVLTGMGSSLYACAPLRLHLVRCGIRTTLVDASELLHYESALLTESVVVLVSRSGESVEIARLLERLHPSSIIGVTDEPASPLAAGAGQVMVLNCGADELVALQSYTGTLVALGILGMSVFDTGAGRWEAALEQIPQSAATVIDRCATDDWSTFLADTAVVYLLGRGMSRASCREGALLFGEAAKTPAVAMAAGAFRHGPVEAVDQRFRGILFATHRETRELDLGLAKQLERFGGRVRVIGPDLPEAPPLLAPVLEIIPVQHAVARLAELRGVELNQFRHATQVTRSEAVFGPNA